MRNPTILFVILIVIGVLGLAVFTGVYSSSMGGLASAKTPEVVELKNGDAYSLKAGVVKKNINGREVKMLAYNGSIPGPIIKVPQGAEVTVNFKNDTDIDSTIHSHGVRVDNDGSLQKDMGSVILDIR